MANYFSITLKGHEHDVNHAKEVLTKMKDISEEDFNFDGAQMAIFVEEKSGKDNCSNLLGFLRLNKKTTEGKAVKWLNTKDITKPDKDPRYLQTTRDPQGYFNYIMKAISPDGLFVYHGDFIPHGGNRKRKQEESDDDPPKQVTAKMMIEYYKAGGHPYNVLDTFGPNIPKDHERLRLMVQNQRKYNKYVEQAQEAKTFWEDKAWPWQLTIKKLMLDLINKKDDRTIVAIQGNFGEEGKSILGKMLWYEDQLNRARLQTGKTNDMSMILSSFDDLELVILDMCREDPKYFSPKILERAKDGIIQNNKYNSRVINLGHPVQCLVLTNRGINWAGASIDRWIVYEVNRIGKGTPEDKVNMEKWSQERLEKVWAEYERKAKQKEEGQEKIC